MKKYSLLISTIILAVVFGRLAMNYSSRYQGHDDRVTLERGVSQESLADAIMLKNYLPTYADAEYAAQHLVSVLETGEELGALYDLNKRAWKIPAQDIRNRGSEYYLARLDEECVRMGQNEEFRSLDRSSLKTSACIDVSQEGQISVVVKNEDNDPCHSVVVRLDEHFINSEGKADSRSLGFAQTDSEGHAIFCGLVPESSYSVIPIRDGFEYGASQGTVGGTLAQVGDDAELECTFTQKEHKIKVFDAITLRNIKSDHIIVVRQLSSFLVTMAVYAGAFLAVWFLLYFLFRRRHPGADSSLITLMMALTGICLVMMFSMNDPLNDKMLGVDMAQGIIAGVIVMILLQAVDFKAFYQGKSRLPFDIPAAFIRLVLWPWRNKVDALFAKLPKGFGYMLTAVGLTLLLFTPLGASVGGMRVNLNVGILFQPSEIAKYLIVIFMAAFFCVKADTVVKFSQKGNIDLFGVKMRMLYGILIGLAFLMGLYLLLGDMGPSMVLAFTFIIMYSFIKSKVSIEGLDQKAQLRHILTCDLAMLVYGILSFILMLYVGSRLGCMWIFCIGWFAAWILFGIFKKQIFESAIVFNLIIAAFIFGASILGAIPGLDGVSERLESRTEMCTNTWGVLPVDGQDADPGENTQVAEGLWGLASGGFAGQGVGKGSPSVIPAFHTDMILASIGEQFGFIGLLVVIVLLVMLLRKTILHGYDSSHPFAFYLCLGVAVVTGVQFIIISMGSTGVIPLTGVTVPFFSYGKVSMILNLAAFGMVLSIAGRNADASEATSEQMLEIRRRQMSMYDYPVAIVSLVFCIIALVIAGVFMNYTIFQREEVLVRPVYVNNINGMPVVEYNPRISLIAEQMPVGNIYDRNGILIATSDVDLLRETKDKYFSYGVDSASLNPHLRSRLKRYYPFGSHLFYMLGDYNSRLFFTSEDQRGYMAEARHLSHLRGYDDRLIEGDEGVKVSLSSDEYSPGRYFGNDSTLMLRNVQLRDYTSLLPALKTGKSIGTVPGNVYLTIDARLQTLIQNKMKAYVENDKSLRNNNLLRISAVAVDANTGELLASSMYPLPDVDRLKSMDDAQLREYDDSGVDDSWKSYADMDLGLLYPTAPGSTAKVMSSLAALSSEDLTTSEIRALSYYNYNEERTGYEYEVNLNRRISMYDALCRSSNSYFINLVNDKELYDELADIYSIVGARLLYEQPYTMFYSSESMIDSLMDVHSKGAVKQYRKYMENAARTGKREPLKKHPAWQLPWGQGELSASPLAMARVASIASGNGKMPVTRYCKTDSYESVPIEGLSKSDLNYLRECMKAEAETHGLKNVYGKTGTAQRSYQGENVQDGWYIGYCEGVNGPIAFAVRLERGPGSGNAWRMFRDAVLPALKETGYVK